MPAIRGRKGTHAKGSCEPGQAGRCSHKQRTLVQWISLFLLPVAGAFLRPAAMAKRKTSISSQSAAGRADGYTVLARRYRPQQFADVIGQEPVAQALANALET